MLVVCRQWVVFTDLLYFELRVGRFAKKDAAQWKDSFNRARAGHKDLDDPVYSDYVYQMLTGATQSNHRLYALEEHAKIQVFRILFAYIRPEL